MECKYCMTENSEKAVYCKHCGKALDERPVCPVCGAKHDEDAVYCEVCGARIDGINVCINCGTEYKGKFCPECGTSAIADRKKSRSTVSAGICSGHWRKIVELCGGIFALAGVFAVLLCTFLFGFNVSLNFASGYEDFESVFNGLIGLNGNRQIWYYFSEGFTEVSDTLSTLDSYTATFESSLLLPVIFNLVISVATILSVTVFSILAAVRFGLKMAGKSNKDYALYVIWAVLSFVIGSAALLAVETGFGIVKEGAKTVYTANLHMNSAGIAGNVCGLVCLGVFLVCRIAIKGKALLQKDNIVRVSCFAVALVLVAVLLFFAGQAGFVMSIVESGERIKLGMSLSGCGQYVAMSSWNNFDVPEPIAELVLASITQIVQSVFIVVAALVIASRMKGLISGEKSGSGLVLSIVLAVFAVAYLVLSIVSTNLSIDYMSGIGLETEGLKLSFSSQITALVFAILNLVLSIVYNAISRKAE